MKYLGVYILIVSLISCHYQDGNVNILNAYSSIEDLNKALNEIVPSGKIIHKGILNPDQTKYYFTISDVQYDQFDIYVAEKNNNEWSKPKEAFINSDYSDHGMTFSPNGQTVYFSSTRPTGTEGVSETWHIWRSTYSDKSWTKPEYVDISNLRDKLVSHPTITGNGKLFFHSSNLDYSDMDIYQSIQIGKKFSPAVKTPIEENDHYMQKCTPYVSADEDYLIFASIGDQLDLMISYNDGTGNWINTRKLIDDTNLQGQGNPWVSPDHELLLYTTGNPDGSNWKIHCTNFRTGLINN